MSKRPKKISVMFSLLTFLTLFLTILLTGLLLTLMEHTGILAEGNRIAGIFLIAAACMIAGTITSRFASRHPLHSIESISRASQEVAKGNFDIQLTEHSQIAELQEMTHNFNIMTRELAGTELLRNDFVENVSHEFKTPLSAIEGYATLLQKKNLSEEKKEEYTKKILLNTRRLSTLTSNILLLSRLENQETGIKKETFSLDEQLRESLLSLETAWSEKKLELEIELDNADYSGNRELLFHVWHNIIGNAIKFSDIGGWIQILLKKEAEQLIIQITDTGIGMKEEICQRIFEKFYQGDHSRSDTGNGLGLALAGRIVTLHGGNISVSSKEGSGSTFTITLPL